MRDVQKVNEACRRGCRDPAGIDGRQRRTNGECQNLPGSDMKFDNDVVAVVFSTNLLSSSRVPSSFRATSDSTQSSLRVSSFSKARESKASRPFREDPEGKLQHRVYTKAVW